MTVGRSAWAAGFKIILTSLDSCCWLLTGDLDSSPTWIFHNLVVTNGSKHIRVQCFQPLKREQYITLKKGPAPMRGRILEIEKDSKHKKKVIIITKLHHVLAMGMQWETG